MSMLALFPLPVVLFPNSALPLHIFEERYKVLIGECLAGGKEFGINLADEGRISELGCTAVVEKLVKRYDDGKLDIIVRGGRRYRLFKIEEGIQPYLLGNIEYLEQESSGMNEKLARETIALHNRVMDLVYNDVRRQLATDFIREGASFVMAQKAGMDLSQRQRLLEFATENDRLEMLHQHFAEIIPKLKTMEMINRVVRSDGYL